MSVPYQDLKGKRFGKLIVVEKSEECDINGTTKKWKCLCDCGNYVNFTTRILNQSLKTKNNISCGCSRKVEYINNIYGDYLIIGYRKDLKDKGKFFEGKCIKCGEIVTLSVNQLRKNKLCQSCHRKEAKIVSTLKHLLCAIRRRCYDEKSFDYKNYGARGIRVCEEWLGDSNKFVKWSLDNGYKKGLTIDRIDNNGNYCPENCRWVDRFVQANNKRSNLNIEYNGKVQTLKQWCKELNIPYRQTHKRIYTYHWDIKRAFEEKIKSRK